MRLLCVLHFVWLAAVLRSSETEDRWDIKGSETVKPFPEAGGEGGGDFVNTGDMLTLIGFAGEAIGGLSGPGGQLRGAGGGLPQEPDAPQDAAQNPRRTHRDAGQRAGVPTHTGPPGLL